MQAVRNYEVEVPVSETNSAIMKEQEKCISCGYCVNVCPPKVYEQQKIGIENNSDILCISCGQCTNICPVEAIKERLSYKIVQRVLKNKEEKCVIFSIAPAVRVALGEEFGFEVGTNLEHLIPSALKSIGADYVFDITFGADLTIMEESKEFLNRLESNEKLPQFTSCCPAWVKYAEVFYKEYLPNLSTTKSPIAMQSTIVKTLFASKIKKMPEDIIHIVVAPCTAKKSEIQRKELSITKQDTDYVLTTRELAALFKEENIDLRNLKPSKFDHPFPVGSGAGVIFGTSGGVSEAAMRTAYYFYTGVNLKKQELNFQELRGMNGMKEATITIKDKTVKVAIVSGLKNLDILMEKIKSKEVSYDFIEVMACPGGCIAGGGQPKSTLLNMQETKKKRMEGLYQEDEKSHLRLCHQNPSILKLYEKYLQYPGSPLAEELLHTSCEDKSYLIEGEK